MQACFRVILSLSLCVKSDLLPETACCLVLYLMCLSGALEFDMIRIKYTISGMAIKTLLLNLKKHTLV